MASQDIQITLYGEKHTGKFSAGNHRYRIDGGYKLGVTTIIGATIAKPGLAMWPMTEALKSLGAHYDETSGRWEIRNEKELGEIGLELTGILVTADMINKAAKASTTKRDKGADTGSIVHAAVEQLLMGEPVDYTQFNAEASRALNAFAGWQKKTQPETISVERVVYSEELDYAGTLDNILRIDGRVYLGDLKTSNASRANPKGIYPEAFIQLGAYHMAYEEERQYMKDRMESSEWEKLFPKVDELMVISCKKNGQVDIATTGGTGYSVAFWENRWLETFNLGNALKDAAGRLNA